jgi:hypothetical protein
MANEVFEMIDSDYVFALEGRVEGLLEQLLEQEAEIIKLKRINKEWQDVWRPINELVSPLTPLGQSVSLSAAKLITERLKQIYE